MRLFIFLLFCFVVSIETFSTLQPPSLIQRHKREVAGALHIVTNHAQPIHEDVKPETGDTNDKPCPEKGLPSAIELGTVFQVTAPQASVYAGKSLRKSLTLSSKLELVRSISRVVSLFVMLFSATLEFYPMLLRLYYLLYGFLE